MNKEFEIICKECGKLFVSKDSAATLCKDCWDKFVKKMGNNDGKGED